MGLISKSDPAEKQIQRQVANSEHMNNLSRMDNDDLDPEYIQQMTESQLSAGTIAMLDNMLSKDWVLANFSEAEVNEERWLGRTVNLILESLHPNDESVWTGEFRKYCSGQANNALEPLDSQQRAIVFQFIQGHTARVTRGRDGWQQDKFNESLTVSERRDNKDNKSGGLLGR